MKKYEKTMEDDISWKEEIAAFIIAFLTGVGLMATIAWAVGAFS